MNATDLMEYVAVNGNESNVRTLVITLGPGPYHKSERNGFHFDRLPLEPNNVYYTLLKAIW